MKTTACDSAVGVCILAGDENKSYDVAQNLRHALLNIKKRWKKSGNRSAYVQSRKLELEKFGLRFPDSKAQSLLNLPIVMKPVEVRKKALRFLDPICKHIVIFSHSSVHVTCSIPNQARALTSADEIYDTSSAVEAGAAVTSSSKADDQGFALLNCASGVSHAPNPLPGVLQSGTGCLGSFIQETVAASTLSWPRQV